MNRLIIFGKSIFLLLPFSITSQIISDHWYELYNANGLKVEISFDVSNNSCQLNGYPTSFEYRYNGYLGSNEKYINWKLDYLNCNDSIYTYSNGVQIGGKKIIKALGNNNLEDAHYEDYEYSFHNKYIQSLIYEKKLESTINHFNINSNLIDSGYVHNGLHTKEYETGTYEGYFLNGKKSGKGTYLYKNGDKYEGDFKNDKINGYGSYIYNNGDIYKGSFYNDVKSGKGYYLYINGDKYEGYFKDDKKNGYGTYTSKSGDIYKGNWIDGMKSGKGNHLFSNGDKYEGEFKQGRINGFGKYTLENGKIHEGNFVDGKRLLFGKLPLNIRQQNKNSFFYTIDPFSPLNISYSLNYDNKLLTGFYIGLKYGPNLKFVENNNLVYFYNEGINPPIHKNPLEIKKVNYSLIGGISKKIINSLWFTAGIGFGIQNHYEKHEYIYNSTQFPNLNVNEEFWYKSESLSGFLVSIEADLQVKIADRAILKYGIHINGKDGNIYLRAGIGYAFNKLDP